MSDPLGLLDYWFLGFLDSWLLFDFCIVVEFLLFGCGAMIRNTLIHTANNEKTQKPKKKLSNPDHPIIQDFNQRKLKLWPLQGSTSSFPMIGELD